MVKKTIPSSGTGLIAHLIFMVALSISLMVLNYRGHTVGLHNFLQSYISKPIKISASWPQDFSKDIDKYFADKSELQKENAKLKAESIWLKANLANQTVIEAEYRRLKLLFDSTATHTRPVIIAEVLDSQIDANKHQIEITKGASDSAFEGQVAIDQKGLVGQITALTDNAAVISLITDERQRVPVFIERNRLQMIARGSGNLNRLEMIFVDKESDVRKGDKIVTSGLGGRFPRGYGVGTVLNVDKSPASEFLEVEVKPLADLDRLLEVLLISKTLTMKDNASKDVGN